MKAANKKLEELFKLAVLVGSHGQAKRAEKLLKEVIAGSLQSGNQVLLIRAKTALGDLLPIQSRNLVTKKMDKKTKIYTDIALHNLFSKYGFEDGELEGVAGINKKFGVHLNSKGFACNIIFNDHNPRITQIKIGGDWYDTYNLMPGPPNWKLTRELEDGSDKEIPVPKKLEEAILGFMPVVAKFLDRDWENLDLMSDNQIEYSILNEEQLEKLALGADLFVATSALVELSIRYKKSAPAIATKVLASPFSDKYLKAQAKEILKNDVH